MATIIAITNRKGGVGKTATTTNLGAALARAGYPTLLVDMDAQYSLTRSLRVTPPQEGNVYDVLAKGAKLQPVPVYDNLDVAAATKDLAYCEIGLAQEDGGKFKLKAALGDVAGKYDYILVDTPPALGFLTINALTAADYAIIPLQPEYLALQGLADALLNIRSVQEGLNPGLKIGGVLLTRYDRRLVLSRKAKKSVEQYLHDFGDGALFTTEIRNNIVVAEAPALGQDVLTYAPDSKAAADYATLAQEVAEKLRKK